MRKPRRLTPEELAPFQWQMPLLRSGQWTVGSGQTKKAETATQTEERQVGSSLPTTHCPLPTPAIDWQALFGNANPVEIEVGMGKGLFLLTAAAARPDTNFFGIEIVRKYQLYATTRFAIRALLNVKTVCADARWVFRQFVAAESVAAVHVYYPDPWWKARHKKRRVFTPGFAVDAARVLRAGGRIRLATDVEEYFGVMTGMVRAMSAFREVRSETSRASIEEAGFQTNFERKARQTGSPIWRAEFERTAEPIAEAIGPAE